MTLVKVVITVNKNKLPNLSEQMPQIQQKGLNLTGQGMIRELKTRSPVDHGLLRSWFFASHSQDEINIQTPAKYAKFVNDGTGIYGPYNTPIIHPSIGKKFAFQVNGQMVYTRMIRGQKGQHFVEKSIEATKQRIGEYFMIAIREVLG